MISFMNHEFVFKASTENMIINAHHTNNSNLPIDYESALYREYVELYWKYVTICVIDGIKPFPKMNLSNCKEIHLVDINFPGEQLLFDNNQYLYIQQLSLNNVTNLQTISFGDCKATKVCIRKCNDLLNISTNNRINKLYLIDCPLLNNLPLVKKELFIINCPKIEYDLEEFKIYLGNTFINRLEIDNCPRIRYSWVTMIKYKLFPLQYTTIELTTPNTDMNNIITMQISDRKYIINNDLNKFELYIHLLFEDEYPNELIFYNCDDTIYNILYKHNEINVYIFEIYYGAPFRYHFHYQSMMRISFNYYMHSLLPINVTYIGTNFDSDVNIISIHLDNCLELVEFPLSNIKYPTKLSFENCPKLELSIVDLYDSTIVQYYKNIIDFFCINSPLIHLHSMIYDFYLFEKPILFAYTNQELQMIHHMQQKVLNLYNECHNYYTNNPKLCEIPGYLIGSDDVSFSQCKRRKTTSKLFIILNIYTSKFEATYVDKSYLKRILQSNNMDRSNYINYIDLQQILGIGSQKYAISIQDLQSIYETSFAIYYLYTSGLFFKTIPILFQKIL